MGFNPAFSLSVYGMISSASANALKQYASAPVKRLQIKFSIRDQTHEIIGKAAFVHRNSFS